MTILLKNKGTLVCEDFIFHCSIGKHGVTKNKIEGDNHAKSIEQYGNVKVLEKISFFKDLNKKKIISLSKKTSFNVFKL